MRRISWSDQRMRAPDRDWQGERARARPAGAVMDLAIALGLYMGSSTREVLRCLLEGLRWLWGAEAVKVAGKSGISQARSRLGEAPLQRCCTGRWSGRSRRAPAGRTSSTRLAAGQPGRLLPGCRRHRGEPHRLRLSGSQPRRERLPAAPLRRPGRERDAPAVRGAGTGQRRGRDDAGACGAGGAPARHAVPGRPAVLRICALAQRSRPAAPICCCGASTTCGYCAKRCSASGTYLTTDCLPQRQGPAASQLPSAGACGRVPAGWHRRGRAALPLGDHDLRRGAASTRGGTGRALSQSAGRSRAASPS